MWIVPVSSTSPAQPGGTSRVDSGSSTTAGPSIAVPGAGVPRSTASSISSPSRVAVRAAALQLVLAVAGLVERDLGPGNVADTRRVTSSSSCSASR